MNCESFRRRSVTNSLPWQLRSRKRTTATTKSSPVLKHLARSWMMTVNPKRGEVWRIRFDPAEGDEIKKTRLAVVISENAVGRLRLKIVVPITEWKPRYASYPWFVQLVPTPT